MAQLGYIEKYDAGVDPCAGFEGGFPISVDPVESGTPAPSWMGSGGEWTSSRQVRGPTIGSPPEQRLLSAYFCT